MSLNKRWIFTHILPIVLIVFVITGIAVATVPSWKKATIDWFQSFGPSAAVFIDPNADGPEGASPMSRGVDSLSADPIDFKSNIILPPPLSEALSVEYQNYNFANRTNIAQDSYLNYEIKQVKTCPVADFFEFINVDTQTHNNTIFKYTKTTDSGITNVKIYPKKTFTNSTFKFKVLSSEPGTEAYGETSGDNILVNDKDLVNYTWSIASADVACYTRCKYHETAGYFWGEYGICPKLAAVKVPGYVDDIAKYPQYSITNDSGHLITSPITYSPPKEDIGTCDATKYGVMFENPANILPINFSYRPNSYFTDGWVGACTSLGKEYRGVFANWESIGFNEPSRKVLIKDPSCKICPDGTKTTVTNQATVEPRSELIATNVTIDSANSQPAIDFTNTNSTIDTIGDQGEFNSATQSYTITIDESQKTYIEQEKLSSFNNLFIPSPKLSHKAIPIFIGARKITDNSVIAQEFINPVINDIKREGNDQSAYANASVDISYDNTKGSLGYLKLDKSETLNGKIITTYKFTAVPQSADSKYKVTLDSNGFSANADGFLVFMPTGSLSSNDKIEFTSTLATGSDKEGTITSKFNINYKKTSILSVDISVKQRCQENEDYTQPTESVPSPSPSQSTSMKTWFESIFQIEKAKADTTPSPSSSSTESIGESCQLCSAENPCENSILFAGDKFTMSYKFENNKGNSIKLNKLDFNFTDFDKIITSKLDHKLYNITVKKIGPSSETTIQNSDLDFIYSDDGFDTPQSIDLKEIELKSGEYLLVALDFELKQNIDLATYNKVISNPEITIFDTTTQSQSKFISEITKPISKLPKPKIEIIAIYGENGELKTDSDKNKDKLLPGDIAEYKITLNSGVDIQKLKLKVMTPIQNDAYPFNFRKIRLDSTTDVALPTSIENDVSYIRNTKSEIEGFEININDLYKGQTAYTFRIKLSDKLPFYDDAMYEHVYPDYNTIKELKIKADLRFTDVEYKTTGEVSTDIYNAFIGSITSPYEHPVPAVNIIAYDTNDDKIAGADVSVSDTLSIDKKTIISSDPDGKYEFVTKRSRLDYNDIKNDEGNIVNSKPSIGLILQFRNILPDIDGKASLRYWFIGTNDKLLSWKTEPIVYDIADNTSTRKLQKNIKIYSKKDGWKSDPAIVYPSVKDDIKIFNQTVMASEHAYWTYKAFDHVANNLISDFTVGLNTEDLKIIYNNDPVSIGHTYYSPPDNSMALQTYNWDIDGSFLSMGSNNYMPHTLLHEFSHFVQDYLLKQNGQRCEGSYCKYQSNHSGYINDFSYDSFLEGFATFNAVYLYNIISGHIASNWDNHNYYYSGIKNNLSKDGLGNLTFDVLGDSLKNNLSVLIAKEENATISLLTNLFMGRTRSMTQSNNTHFYQLNHNNGRQSGPVEYNLKLGKKVTELYPNMTERMKYLINTLKMKNFSNYDFYKRIRDDKKLWAIGTSINEIGLDQLDQFAIILGMFYDANGNWRFDYNKDNPSEHETIGKSANGAGFDFSDYFMVYSGTGYQDVLITDWIEPRPTRHVTDIPDNFLVLNSTNSQKISDNYDTGTKKTYNTYTIANIVDESVGDSSDSQSQIETIDLPVNFSFPIEPISPGSKLFILASDSPDYKAINYDQYISARTSSNLSNWGNLNFRTITDCGKLAEKQAASYSAKESELSIMDMSIESKTLILDNLKKTQELDIDDCKSVEGMEPMTLDRAIELEKAKDIANAGKCSYSSDCSEGEICKLANETDTVGQCEIKPEEPTPTTSPTPIDPTSSASASVSPTPSQTVEVSPTPSISPSITVSPEPTISPTVSVSSTPVTSVSPSPSSTPSVSLSANVTITTSTSTAPADEIDHEQEEINDNIDSQTDENGDPIVDNDMQENREKYLKLQQKLYKKTQDYILELQTKISEYTVGIDPNDIQKYQEALDKAKNSVGSDPIKYSDSQIVKSALLYLSVENIQTEYKQKVSLSDKQFIAKNPKIGAYWLATNAGKKYTEKENKIIKKHEAELTSLTSDYNAKIIEKLQSVQAIIDQKDKAYFSMISQKASEIFYTIFNQTLKDQISSVDPNNITPVIPNPIFNPLDYTQYRFSEPYNVSPKPTLLDQIKNWFSMISIQTAKAIDDVPSKGSEKTEVYFTKVNASNNIDNQVSNALSGETIIANIENFDSSKYIQIFIDDKFISQTAIISGDCGINIHIPYDLKSGKHTVKIIGDAKGEYVVTDISITRLKSYSWIYYTAGVIIVLVSISFIILKRKKNTNDANYINNSDKTNKEGDNHIETLQDLDS